MKFVAVSQRIQDVLDIGERRDCLDQRWSRLLEACGLIPLPIPNHPEVAARLLGSMDVSGILLTGGNDLASLGGDVPERDETERVMMEHALRHDLPLLGVCRGMQVIQERWGVPLERVEGHVTPRLEVRQGGRWMTVNSYHRFGARTTVPELEVTAQAADGVVKAVRHRGHRVMGVMWHPERIEPFREDDVTMIREHLAGEGIPG